MEKTIVIVIIKKKGKVNLRSFELVIYFIINLCLFIYKKKDLNKKKIVSF